MNVSSAGLQAQFRREIGSLSRVDLRSGSLDGQERHGSPSCSFVLCFDGCMMDDGWRPFPCASFSFLKPWATQQAYMTNLKRSLKWNVLGTRTSLLGNLCRTKMLESITALSSVRTLFIYLLPTSRSIVLHWHPTDSSKFEMMRK